MLPEKSFTSTDMRQAVFAAKPGLARLIAEKGKTALLSYSYPAVSAPEKQKNEVLDVVQSAVDRLFGKGIAAEAVKQLKEQWYVSTAEHHGPVNHPFVVSGTFITSTLNQRRGWNTTLVFSTSNISLNNSSFPRGFTVHTSELHEQRLFLQPWKYRQQPVGCLPAIDGDVYSELVRKVSGFDERLGELFRGWQEKIMIFNSFVDQISVLNEIFWRQLPGQETGHLIYLPQEEIVSSLLEKYHLGKQTILHELFFNKEWRSAFARNFEGLTGAFSGASNRGTFLFWAIVDNRRVGLMEKGDILVSLDGSFRLALTAEAVGAALTGKKIVPGMALTFIVLSCYYELQCGGGFSQVDYLPQLQKAWRAMMSMLTGDVMPVTESSFLSSDYAFVSLQSRLKQVLATGLDLALYGQELTYQRIIELAESTTLESAVDNLMPDLYSIVAGQTNMRLNVVSPMQSCIYV